MTIQTKLIAVEGIDGVGKSSFCSLLAQKMSGLNVAAVKTPYGELNHLADMARKQGKLAAFCAYMLSNIATVLRFVECEWLILDRYVLSTIVYHKDIYNELSPTLRSLLFSTLKKPELTILLTAELNTVAERLVGRVDQSSNHKIPSVDLEQRFEVYIADSDIRPLLGKLFVMPSNTPTEQEEALDLILNEISGLHR